MNSTRVKASMAAVVLVITLVMALGIALTVLFVGGWKTERETTETKFSLAPGIEFERRTERQMQEGNPALPQPQPAPTTTAAPADPSPKVLVAAPTADENAPYIGGNYVSKRSSIRYVIDEKDGSVEMYGYNVRRGRRVFVGSGRMTGRRLIIPNFYSFLDDTYGTLKLDLSKDGKMLEGKFEGLNPAKEGRVLLTRLP